MERKLELCDIAGYLPYGLYVDANLLSGKYCNKVLGLYESELFVKYSHTHICLFLNTVKPILYPIDSLYGPITHNGKEIVPIVELAKIVRPNYDWKLSKDNICYACGEKPNFFIIFYYQDNAFEVYNTRGIKSIYGNQYQLFDYLHELKIDYRRLIDAGLAIDCNTLDINPYK